MRKKSVLIALVILALGLVGASLSTLYEHDERFGSMLGGTFKASYGFPLGWHGYSTNYGGPPLVYPSTWPVFYWFSLESFLLDTAFWVVISFFVSLAAIKSAQALNFVAMVRAGVLGMKTSILLLVMSLSLIAIGVGLCLFAQTTGPAQVWFGYVISPMKIRPYLDLGLRLIGSGTVSLIATLSVMLWKPSNVRTREEYRDAANSREV